MEWICRDCGNEVVAADRMLVITVGWTALDGDTGICPSCIAHPNKMSHRLLVERSKARIDESRHLLAIGRELIEKARRG